MWWWQLGEEGKQKNVPLEVGAPQSSQVCKAFTSQRYTSIFIKNKIQLRRTGA